MKSLVAGAARLTNSQLRAHLRHLAKREREATANLIAHLAEFDKRELYLSEGCSSMFQFCVQVLHLSEPAACKRIQAIRAVRECPTVLTRLHSGELTLSNLSIVTPLLTPENCEDLLSKVRYKSKREVEKLAADMRPRPDAPTSISRAPRRHKGKMSSVDTESSSDPASMEVAAEEFMATSTQDSLETTSSEIGETGRSPLDRDPGGSGSTAFALSPPPRPVVAPLGLDRYKVQFTASAEMHDRLRRAQTLLLPVIPDGDVAAVFDAALVLLVKHLEKTRRGATDRPRPNAVPRPRSRRISAHLKRLVYQRDGERCTETGIDGQRCRATDRLVIDHIVPFADGGETRLENLRILCRAHNQHAAKGYFGPEVIEGHVASTKKLRVTKTPPRAADQTASKAASPRAPM